MSQSLFIRATKPILKPLELPTQSVKIKDCKIFAADPKTGWKIVKGDNDFIASKFWMLSNYVYSRQP